jgi:aspartate racemase
MVTGFRNPIMRNDKEGRTLGLIGGLGPGATVHYYRELLAAHKAQGRVARMLIAHADVDYGRPLAEAGKLDELARYLNSFIDQTAAGGAEMAAIVAVTPHICSAQLLPLLRIPLIDMVSTVADAIRERGLKRVALFGTRSTVQSRMFSRLGVDVIVPSSEEIDIINSSYLDFVYDRHTPATIDRLRELAHTLIKRDGAEAVLLAGTDLSMVMNEENAGFPTIDCAGVHIAEIAKQLLA